MDMDLRHLRYFVAVAEEGHVTRAAERLGIQQPPLSQQIKALEAELEVQLFRRKPRGVELTEAGAGLLIDARRILDEVDDALIKVRRTARGELGRLTIGFNVSAPFHPIMPRVLRDFRAASPGVSVTLREGASLELAEDVRKGRIDAAFVRGAVPEGDGVVSHLLLQERMVAALPATHPLAGGGTGGKGGKGGAGGKGAKGAAGGLPLSALAEEAFVLYRRSTGPGLYDAIIRACNEVGFSPQLAQQAPRITAVLNLVAAGLGVTVVPQSLSGQQTADIVYRPLTAPRDLVAPLRLVCRTVEHGAAASRLIALVRAEAKKYGGPEKR